MVGDSKRPCSVEYGGCAFTSKSQARDRRIACIYGGCAFMEGAFMEGSLYVVLAHWPVGTMENERIAEKLRDPEGFGDIKKKLLLDKIIPKRRTSKWQAEFTPFRFG
jgi:hypothetical protein